MSLLSETNYELNSKVKLTARLGGTQRDVRTILAPAPGQLVIPEGRHERIVKECAQYRIHALTIIFRQLAVYAPKT